MMANEDAITITNNHERTRRVYHVFVSFSRSDTRFTLVGNLFTALIRESFKTFTDDENLMGGNQNVAATLEALKGSKIAIVVLTKNYLASSYCLDELVAIRECSHMLNQRVIPIFYDVDPSDIKHHTGTYSESIAKHEERFGKDSIKLQNWKLALSEVAFMSAGLHFKKGYQYEHGLIKDTVNYVYRTLPRYDVFLSFSEQDTRYSFSGHLYNALNEEGFQTFMKDIIRKEDQTSESLVKVIEKSRLSIIVLSENYAYSSSCLDELLTILDFTKKNNQLLVWPIFYKVEPTIIRYQKNSYEKAMNEHEIEYGKDSEKVKAWRSALFEVASLNGRHLKDGYDYEYQFVEKIVKAAIKI